MRHVDTASTDQSIRVWAYDADGAAITGEAYNSAGIAASVVVRSAGRIVSTTALTLVARTSVGVHRDSAFTEVGSGGYVIDLPDSYFATAGREVSVTLASTAITGGYVLSESLEVSAALATKAVVDSIAVALAGMSPVEPTGVTVFELLEQILDSTGTGARTVTVTVNDGTTALQNAKVRLTDGANTYTGLTNASGVVTFNVDDATYTVSITKSGYSFAGTTLVVDGTEAVTYSMTVTSVTPPTEPSLSAVEVMCLSATFTAQSGIAIDFRLAAIPSGDQNRAMPSAKVTVTSDADGIARWEAPQGATIEYKRGSTQVWTKVVLDNDSVTNVQSVIGSP